MAARKTGRPDMQNHKVRLLTLVEPAQYDMLRDLADTSGTSISAVVRSAVNQYFKVAS